MCAKRQRRRSPLWFRMSSILIADFDWQQRRGQRNVESGQSLRDRVVSVKGLWENMSIKPEHFVYLFTASVVVSKVNRCPLLCNDVFCSSQAHVMIRVDWIVPWSWCDRCYNCYLRSTYFFVNNNSSKVEHCSCVRMGENICFLINQGEIKIILFQTTFSSNNRVFIYVSWDGKWLLLETSIKCTFLK